MGPTLPKYIVTIIIHLPSIFKLAVKFLESPTVAVALTASYMTSSAEASLTAINKMIEVKQIEINMTDTATALRMESADMQRPNKFALFLFLIVAMAEETSTITVTVFIPPAVPTGEPPISIKISDTIEEAFVKFS